MKNLIKDKSFIVGMIFGLLIFGTLNITLSGYTQTIAGCLSSGKAHGFPFTYVDECHNPTFMRINFAGLVLDILFMIAINLSIGLIFKFNRSKFTSKKLK